MLFTTFVVLLAVGVVLGIGALLALRWKSPAVGNLPLAPITVAVLTAGLVALGFLVV